MKINRTISTSAFMVNESRARNVDLSRDIYAKLWVTEETIKIWKDFSDKVYPHDAAELGIRNRFFLEQLNQHIQLNPNSVFVNIGAGFTSYPFLTDYECKTVEVDYPHIISFKKKHIKQWQKEGKMPGRKIDFIGVDLNHSNDLIRLKQELRERIQYESSLVLMEGVTYYLDPDRFKEILKTISFIQVSGSILTFDFWENETMNHPGCIRFKKYLAENLGHEKKYNHFNADYVRAIPGYSLITLTDVQEQEARFSDHLVLSERTELILDTYAVLKRK